MILIYTLKMYEEIKRCYYLFEKMGALDPNSRSNHSQGPKIQFEKNN